MSLTARFKTDNELETNGAKFEMPANDDGSIPTFYIARMSNSNPRYLKTLNAEMKPFQRELQLGTLGEEKARDLQISIFAGSILVGWENVLSSDVDGNSETSETFAPYSKANAMSLLKNLPELHNSLTVFASNMANYLAASREEAAKN